MADLTYTGRFGAPMHHCKVCKKELKELRVLNIAVSHKASGTRLGWLQWSVPLCDEHRDGAPLDVEISWQDALEPLQDVMTP